MKVMKLVVMVIDFEEMGEDEIIREIERCRYSMPKVFSIESRDIGEWHDEHPLNKKLMAKGEFDRLFN